MPVDAPNSFNIQFYVKKILLHTLITYVNTVYIKRSDLHVIKLF